MQILGLSVALWQIYIVIGIILCALEIFAPGFVLLPIGLAFFSTAVLATFNTQFIYHLAFLAISSVIMLIVFRKYMQGMKPKDAKTNADSMVGATAKVIEDINNKEGTGYIKLYGDEWRALSETGELFSRGDTVEILRLQGNKVFVLRKEE